MKIMKRISIILIALVLLISTGCATIITGSNRVVLFETDPSGAKVFVNGVEKGKTPVQLKVRADDRIDFRLDNYRERVVVMDSKFNAVAILNAISILGWGIDAITGSLERVDTKYIKETASEVAKNISDNNLVILRSTVAIGTTRKIIDPILKKSKKK